MRLEPRLRRLTSCAPWFGVVVVDVAIQGLAIGDDRLHDVGNAGQAGALDVGAIEHQYRMLGFQIDVADMRAEHFDLLQLRRGRSRLSRPQRLAQRRSARWPGMRRAALRRRHFAATADADSHLSTSAGFGIVCDRFDRHGEEQQSRRCRERRAQRDRLYRACRFGMDQVHDIAARKRLFAAAGVAVAVHRAGEVAEPADAGVDRVVVVPMPGRIAAIEDGQSRFAPVGIVEQYGANLAVHRLELEDQHIDGGDALRADVQPRRACRELDVEQVVRRARQLHGAAEQEIDAVVALQTARQCRQTLWLRWHARDAIHQFARLDVGDGVQIERAITGIRRGCGDSSRCGRGRSVRRRPRIGAAQQPALIVRQRWRGFATVGQATIGEVVQLYTLLDFFDRPLRRRRAATGTSVR